MAHPRSTALALAAWIHRIAAALLGLAAAALAGVTLAGAAGLLPVLSVPLRIGETVIPDAGLAVQSALLLLLLSVLAGLPGGFRVLKLERSHRDFAVCLSDVAEAYRACHAADRGGAFRLASEYEAVKQRIVFLQAHPDLGVLEPELLELAAKMSFVSRELARTYSDEALARARDFLRQREEEIALFETRLAAAREVGHDLRRRLEALRAGEAGMADRVAALESELGDLLRDLGIDRPAGGTVAIGRATAAE